MGKRVSFSNFNEHSKYLRKKVSVVGTLKHLLNGPFNNRLQQRYSESGLIRSLNDLESCINRPLNNVPM
jgi:hypothetical protein